MSDFVYLYGFVPADASPPSNLSGIDGRPVEIINAGVAAAISRVPADVYDPERIEPRLQDLNWVAAQGVAHETVVAWFVDHAEILPVSLFTMYSSDVALSDAVAARADELASELARLKNQREWDVKVSFDEKQVEQHAGELSASIAELEREAAEAAPGKRYLLERKRNDLVKDETRKAAQRIAQEVIEAAMPMTTDTRTLPIPRTTEDLPVILFAALLVSRDREAELIRVLQQQAARLEALGMGLSFSGPWAPYRFTGERVE